jgi:NO-binding membrane sensor protein with MHYT domain
MPISHGPWLVALSLAVAIQGSYVGLSLALRFATGPGAGRRRLLAGAALSLGVGIWAMHFIAMLAARLPGPVDYLVFPTLLSMLVCIIVVGVAVVAASLGAPAFWRIASAGTFMGVGIASMHYIGMAALHASLHLEHALPFVMASVAIGIAASALALWLCFVSRRHPPLIVAATALGIAISGMHYTAMAGLTAFPLDAGAPMPSAALSTDLLATVVAVVAFVVSGVFLLALVPERLVTAQTQEARAAAVEASSSGLADLGAAGIQPANGSEAPGTDEPPWRRRRGERIPIARAGAVQWIAAEDIVAVHANAHYTYVFDGLADLFCSLSISEVEERLDPSRFLRVHRSHIVNVDHVTTFRKVRDNGVLELGGAAPRNVPVSRGRIGSLKALLGRRASAAAE